MRYDIGSFVFHEIEVKRKYCAREKIRDGSVFRVTQGTFDLGLGIKIITVDDTIHTSCSCFYTPPSYLIFNLFTIKKKNKGPFVLDFFEEKKILSKKITFSLKMKSYFKQLFQNLFCFLNINTFRFFLKSLKKNL